MRRFRSAPTVVAGVALTAGVGILGILFSFSDQAGAATPSDLLFHPATSLVGGAGPIGDAASSARSVSQVLDVCGEGELIAALTVSTAGGELEFPPGGESVGISWGPFPGTEWDALYGDLWEWGPRGQAVEIPVLGDPGTRVCFSMVNEQERKAELLGDSAPVDNPNVSMQWAYVFETPPGVRVDQGRANEIINMSRAQATIGDDGTLVIRWREGSDGTSATYTLATLEVRVADGVTLPAPDDTVPATIEAPAAVWVATIGGAGSGDVEITRDGVTRALRPDEILQPTDRIYTGIDVTVVLRSSNGDTVTIGELTDLTVQAATGGTDVATRLWLAAGKITNDIFRFQGARSDFWVKSPTATASVRGTEFSVEVLESDRTIVEVVSGEVEIDPTEDGLPTVIAGPGERVEVGSTEMITPNGETVLAARSGALESPTIWLAGAAAALALALVVRGVRGRRRGTDPGAGPPPPPPPPPPAFE